MITKQTEKVKIKMINKTQNRSKTRRNNPRGLKRGQSPSSNPSLNLKAYIKGRSAVFIDAANILYSQQTLGWQVDYKKLSAWLKSSFEVVFIGFYYGKVRGNAGQERFFAMLKDRGYTLRTKPVKYIKTKKGIILKGNLDIELAFDALTRKDDYDTCLLFSGDSDFEIVVDYLVGIGKKVLVFSTKGHIAIELIRAANKYVDIKKLRRFIERKNPPPKAEEVYSG